MYNICNTWELFSKNITELENTLKRNSFPPKIINREINKYLNKTYKSNNTTLEEENKTINYYKLPFLGITSKYTQIKISELCKNLCKKLTITLSFNTCKVGSFLSSKSKPLPGLQSFVVYKYLCPSCAASYVGETTRHWGVRVKEHLLKDKKSHIYQHINMNNNCTGKSDNSSFKIIDKASTEYTLKIKEAVHINWIKPTLNKQKIHIKLTIDI